MIYDLKSRDGMDPNPAAGGRRAKPAAVAGAPVFIRTSAIFYYHRDT